jgi:hypothetical protein
MSRLFHGISLCAHDWHPDRKLDPFYMFLINKSINHSMPMMDVTMGMAE